MDGKMAFVLLVYWLYTRITLRDIYSPAIGRLTLVFLICAPAFIMATIVLRRFLEATHIYEWSGYSLVGPVEELTKICLALTVAALFPVNRSQSALALAILPGAAFSVYETLQSITSLNAHNTMSVAALVGTTVYGLWLHTHFSLVSCHALFSDRGTIRQCIAGFLSAAFCHSAWNSSGQLAEFLNCPDTLVRLTLVGLITTLSLPIRVTLLKQNQEYVAPCSYMATAWAGLIAALCIGLAFGRHGENVAIFSLMAFHTLLTTQKAQIVVSRLYKGFQRPR